MKAAFSCRWDRHCLANSFHFYQYLWLGRKVYTESQTKVTFHVNFHSRKLYFK